MHQAAASHRGRLLGRNPIMESPPCGIGIEKLSRINKIFVAAYTPAFTDYEDPPPFLKSIVWPSTQAKYKSVPLRFTTAAKCF
jgi:hypothetical protein